MRTQILISAVALLSWGSTTSASAYPRAATRVVQIDGRGDEFCGELHDAAGGDNCRAGESLPIPQPSKTYSKGSKPTPAKVPEDSTRIPEGTMKETKKEVEWVEKGKMQSRSLLERKKDS
ncbi:hypothetical protein CCMSSC00406_0004017 [Pleurotus cornucopiae]|uniref:Uncharacterized protein n=1 Tax=Pleurotus cornucopiae TaxID=5321 RepID=A0ACB7ISF2_PLECO|nr:hypothetical protein CCMSSC00406_0004017 [Pleurotus cornucopiae]